MPNLTPGQQNLATIWGSIQTAVRDPELAGLPSVTQYVWSSYQQSYLARGEQPPRATVADMGGLMSIAYQQRNAERALGAAIGDFSSSGLDQAITGTHVAPDIDSRSLDQQVPGPLYRVRFQAAMTIDGEPVTQYLTWSTGFVLPASVSELLDSLSNAGDTAAQDYGMEFADVIGPISIVAV